MGSSVSSLQDAAADGDLYGLQRLLKDKCKHHPDGNDLGLANSNNTLTPLHWAVQQGHLQIVKCLLEAGANPNKTYELHNNQGDNFEWSSIHEACRQESGEVLQELLNHGGDSNKQAYHLMSPLHTATWHGRVHIIKILLEHNCDVNQVDRFKESAIVVPICHGDAQVVNQLLLAGCRLNSRSWGNIRKIRGKNETDFRQTMYGREGPYTFLPLAIKYSWLHIARLLLYHGINPNKYEIEIILQHIKVEVGSIDEDGCKLVECLLESGYKFRSRDALDLQRLLDKIPYDAGYNEELLHSLIEKSNSPCSLSHICRSTIRNHLRLTHRYGSIVKSLSCLPLPPALLRYISLTDYADTHVEGSHGCHPSYDRTEQLYMAMPRKHPTKLGTGCLHPYWHAQCCRH